jgi:hypothetical protein
MLSNTFISLSSHKPVLDIKYFGLKSTHSLLGFKKISESYPNPLSQSKFFSKNEKRINLWFRLQSLVIDLANDLKYILSPYPHIICLTLNIMVLKPPIIYWVSEVLVKSYPNPFIPIKDFLEK